MALDALVIVVKAVLGGTLVSAFAVVGHVLRPKWFAGLFGAAPSVAIASLSVAVLDKGHHTASIAAYAMIFGAAGFVVFGLCVRPLMARFHAAWAALLGCAAWVLVAVGAYLLVVG